MGHLINVEVINTSWMLVPMKLVQLLDSVQGDGAGEPWTGSSVLLCAP